MGFHGTAARGSCRCRRSPHRSRVDRTILHASYPTPCASDVGASSGSVSPAVRSASERLNLAVDQILPLHGRKVPLAELQKWIGKAS
jgi:hypothetical protein